MNKTIVPRNDNNFDLRFQKKNILEQGRMALQAANNHMARNSYIQPRQTSLSHYE